jgi:hypothetical protein
MFDAWQGTTVPRVVVAATHAVGFVPFEHDRQIFLEFGRSTATRIRHWTETPRTEALRRMRLVDNPHQEPLHSTARCWDPSIPLAGFIQPVICCTEFNDGTFRQGVFPPIRRSPE